tara:strand:- start:53921 stop:55270 length:1350 start_codon:yes stop_codon:yes gene_type:complete
MKLNILLLCNKPQVGHDADTIIEHISAFENYSHHKVWVCSNIGNLPKQLELDKFDVIIIHYSLCLFNSYYMSDAAKKKVRSFSGLKIVFVQDEYRQINKMIHVLKFLNVDILFSCFPEIEINKIYTKESLPNVSKYNNLTGYISEKLLTNSKRKRISTRPIHVGYRARKLPFWYGELSYEKWNIVEQWREHVSGKNLELDVDISYLENDRIYGHKWTEFLSSCKTTLGVESGASVMDFTGELEQKINLHQLLNPNDSFFDVQARFLQDHEGQFKLNQISPRCFEAIALGTVLILYEGEYSGILIPERHYIELKKDFSNIAHVIAKIKDDDYLQTMADVAFKEIALNPNYSYEGFVISVDDIIKREFRLRRKENAILPYSESDFLRDIKTVPISDKIYQFGLRKYKRLPSFIQTVIKVIVKPKAIIKLIVIKKMILASKIRNVKHSGKIL